MTELITAYDDFHCRAIRLMYLYDTRSRRDREGLGCDAEKKRRKDGFQSTTPHILTNVLQFKKLLRKVCHIKIQKANNLTTIDL